MGLHVLVSVISTFVILEGLAPPLLVLASAPCHFPAIFNFGDSNSDTGGLSAVFGQAPPPDGETYFHSPAGRYCDGRLIVDFMAESFGLPHLSAYLDSVGSNFSHGANFATAGSTIRPQNTTLRQSGFSPISLDVQWNEFYDFHRRSQIVRCRGGVYEKLLPKAEDFSKALYAFDIGQNDITSGYFSNMSDSQVKAFIPDLISQFKDIVTWVYGQGGRSFWIHNTGPVGCLAYVLDRIPVLAAEVDRAGCATPFNEVAELFNRQLKDVVVQLRKELPEAALTYVDVYSLKYNLITHARKYGMHWPIL
uniref:Alpha-L-fucosidase 3-like n=1 Tax=Rhizophora mucronata TaxID=61149 RepID=A0A2P2K9U0_RHIMU